MLEAGDCFLIETNYSEDGSIVAHLHIILLPPEEHTKNTIIVQINTLRSQKQDKTMILNPGDHEFIVNPSFVNYNRARILSITSIEAMIEQGIAKIKPPISQEILEKIIDGLRKSDHTPREVLTMYGYFMFRRLKKD